MKSLLEALVIYSSYLVVGTFAANIVMDGLMKTSISTEKKLVITGAVSIVVFLLCTITVYVFLF